LELQVVIHHDQETGQLWANVPQLPGLFAAGRDREELVECLEEGLSLYLKAVSDDHAFVAERVEVATYRVGEEDQKLQPA